MIKILIIEDNPMMLENTQEILELENYKVLTATNGEEGIKVAKEILPHLILCDVNMPVLDGYGVLHNLANDPRTSLIPFIFVTAKADRCDQRKGMELGADDYLTKPFDATDLINAIKIRLRKTEKIQEKKVDNIDNLTDFFQEIQNIDPLLELSKDRDVTVLKKKETLYSEATPAEFLFYIVKGKIKTFKIHNEGKDYVTNVYSSGEFFGFTPLFQEGNYTDNAVALEASEIYKIPREDFLNLILKNRIIASSFIKVLSNNIVDKEQQLLSFAYDTVRRRTAQALVTLAEKFEDESLKYPHIKITREDLASMIGTASETVIRCLREFKDDNSIQISGREIIIKDIEVLRSIRY